MFVISFIYKKSLEEVDFHLPGHLDYLKKQYADGVFIASGRKIPRTGGVILALAETREDLDEIVKQDPFYQHGIADYDIIEFLPGMTCPELEFLKNR